MFIIILHLQQVGLSKSRILHIDTTIMNMKMNLNNAVVFKIFD